MNDNLLTVGHPEFKGNSGASIMDVYNWKQDSRSIFVVVMTKARLRMHGLYSISTYMIPVLKLTISYQIKKLG